MTAIEERVFHNTAGLTKAVAQVVAREMQAAVRRRGSCFVASARTEVVEAASLLLARHPGLPWSRCSFFATDSSPMSNDAMGAWRRLGAAGARLYPVPAVATTGEDAALAYEAQIRSEVPCDSSGLPSFDICILEMGSSGQVAGLLPDSRATAESERLVVVGDGHPSESAILTMTVPVIGNAARIVALATGAERSAMYRTVRAEFAKSPNQARTLAGRLRGQGTVHWLVDREAAGH
jgi:6-phosphogluconolactonase